MELENQYNSPETPIVPEKSPSAGNLTETMLKHLKDASPWLKFIGILGYIGCSFIALAGVFFIIASIALSAFMSDFGDFPTWFFWVFSIIYLAMAVLFFFPAYYTYNFGDKISKHQHSNSDEDLEQAFKNNKSLWKFYGILCIIYLCIIPFSIIVSVIVAIVAVTSL